MRISTGYRRLTNSRSTNGLQRSARKRALASVNHNVAEIDQWEAAHFKEDELRDLVLEAKKEYEDALRRKFFDF